MKTKKYYKVRHNGYVEFMAGIDISILQQSGSTVKVIRKATYNEYLNQLDT